MTNNELEEQSRKFQKMNLALECDRDPVKYRQFVREFRNQGDDVWNNPLFHIEKHKEISILYSVINPGSVKTNGILLTQWALNENAYENNFDDSVCIKLLDTASTKEPFEKVEMRVLSCAITAGQNFDYIEDPMQIIGGRATGKRIEVFRPKTVLEVRSVSEEAKLNIKKIVYHGIAPIPINTYIEASVPRIPFSDVWQLHDPDKNSHLCADNMSPKDFYPAKLLEEFRSRYFDKKLAETEVCPKLEIPTLNITYLP